MKSNYKVLPDSLLLTPVGLFFIALIITSRTTPVQTTTEALFRIPAIIITVVMVAITMMAERITMMTETITTMTETITMMTETITMMTKMITDTVAVARHIATIMASRVLGRTQTRTQVIRTQFNCTTGSFS